MSLQLTTIFLYLSEPPSIETAYNTSSSSILVGWRNNQSSSNHISGYRVSYWEGNSSLSIHIVLCPEWNLSTILTNLTPFTNYCLELSSFLVTNTTASNRSQCQYVTTDEAGAFLPQGSVIIYSLKSRPDLHLRLCNILKILSSLTLSLPQVTKTEFLLTILIQYQAGRWWE